MPLNIKPEHASADDDALGMHWYNSVSENTRSYWHAVAMSAVPADAWLAYKNANRKSAAFFAPLRFGLGTWCVICNGKRKIVCYPFPEGKEERRK